MVDLLDLSARIVDSGHTDQPVNRITQELSELADGVAIVESFSHSVAVRTDAGLVVFDASGAPTGPAVVQSLRQWSDSPVHSLVYTHGHMDHIGGSPAFVADAEDRRHPRPLFIGHAAVSDRIARYRMTDGWNMVINTRQFGWLQNAELTIGAGSGSPARRFMPDDIVPPDVTYLDTHRLDVGGVRFDLHHGRGETDDHTWTWIPSRRAICCGDFLIWNFPNAGNPQKVQRYPREWARSLRDMAVMDAELLVPAHGLPIGGRDRISRVLTHVADVLDDLVDRTLDMMNAGATLDEIIHSVRVPEQTLAVPYLRPFYDEPEFVVRNIWRQYGGWWDANPARLKPAPDATVAAEVAHLSGGASVLVARARELAGTGQPADLQVACQLVEWAAQAHPDDTEVHAARADVYDQRHRAEKSLMAKGIFAGAAKESRRRTGRSTG